MSILSRKQVLLVLLFSVLVVVSQWNAWSTGVLALGFNYSLFWMGVALVIYSFDNRYSIQRDWVWLCPLMFIALGFSLYENPWLKLVSVFVLPVSVAVFCAYAHFYDRRSVYWNGGFIKATCIQMSKPLTMVGSVVDQWLDLFELRSDAIDKSAFSRVLQGLLILIPLGMLVLLLLSSADAAFGETVLRTVRASLDAISWLWLLKLAVSLLLAIALLSIALGWREPVEYTQHKQTLTVDGLVASIVLGGLFIIYCAFLYLQVEHLAIKALPEAYREAEVMVKSGFWQLFLLALINTGLFFGVYRKSDAMAQWVLRVFIVASSLLMVSAAWKLWLYSYTFGLSYEKFFACYTAVFALGVLLYLVVASFSTHRRNVVKTIAFAALWGYAIATLCPIEKVIFHTNLYLAKQNGTRIIVSQLTQLSIDIAGDVDKTFTTDLAIDANANGHWQQWRQQQAARFCDRAWYEFSLSALRACR